MVIRNIIYAHDGEYIYPSIERKLLEYSEYAFAHLNKIKTSVSLEVLSDLPIDYVRADILVILNAEEVFDLDLSKALQKLLSLDPVKHADTWLLQAECVLFLITKELPALAPGFVAYFKRVWKITHLSSLYIARLHAHADKIKAINKTTKKEN